MKKLIALLLALLLASSFLVACSPDEPNTPNGDVPGIGGGVGNGDDTTLSEGSDPAGSDIEWSESLLG